MECPITSNIIAATCSAKVAFLTLVSETVRYMLAHALSQAPTNENRKYNSIYVFLIVLGGGGYAVCVLTRLHALMSIAKLDDIYFPVRYLQHMQVL